jgi:FkbM family methyltransferase
LVDYDFDAYLAQPLPFVKEASRYFKPNDRLIIFEIGACEGEDSIKLSKTFPNAEMYAFEPLPKNVRRMRFHYKKYGAKYIKVEQMALSDNDGTAKFFVSSGQPDNPPESNNWDFGNKSSSLLEPKEHKKVLNWIKFEENIKVNTCRLDSYCHSKKINHIDLVFLDVQGAELKVLEGAGDFLNKIGMIWLEVEAIELYKGQPLKNDVEKFMEAKGFDKIKDTVDDVSGDQLYVNKSLKKQNRGLLSKIRSQS